ncbi:heat shock protein HtpX [Halomicrobium zhouii]|uniref:Heat shock protein HtpX n=1 Tax=Halomicrobium zhouii TaxID=767519 RepID=A0A1I6LZ38_9EURY|nr:M48 family metalloprotease [Halomicrobium zhouii]SFS08648.1 heat shock protein HtpX [Halomicrobium zhouii]
MALRHRSSLRRHLRLVALLAVLVAFDVVAVVAAYVLGHLFFAVMMATQFNPDLAAATLAMDVVPLDLFVLLGTPAVLVAQSVFGYRKTLRHVETIDASADDAPVDEARVAALEGRVTKLAHTASMSPPSVSVVPDETPNSFVVSRPGKRTLFVTTGLLDTFDDDVLDGDELDAILAHELAHLDNGDAFVMTAAAFLPTATRRVVRSFGTELGDGWLSARLRGEDAEWRWRDVVHGYNTLRNLLFVVVLVPVAGVIYFASSGCYRLLSRVREYGADAGGVAICGSPAALASALETLTGDRRPEADLRTATPGIRELCILPYAVGESTSPDDGDADRFDRIAARWDRFCERTLPSSHPEPDERIAALRDR